MKELLEEVDELLAHLEDFTHGEDGERITDLRFKVLEAIRKIDKNTLVSVPLSPIDLPKTGVTSIP